MILKVMHFCKMIGTFHKNNLKKPLMTCLFIDSALIMAKPMVKSLIETLYRKQGQQTKGSHN